MLSAVQEWKFLSILKGYLEFPEVLSLCLAFLITESVCSTQVSPSVMWTVPPAFIVSRIPRLPYLPCLPAIINCLLFQYCRNPLIQSSSRHPFLSCSCLLILSCSCLVFLNCSNPPSLSCSSNRFLCYSAPHVLCCSSYQFLCCSSLLWLCLSSFLFLWLHQLTWRLSCRQPPA